LDDHVLLSLEFPEILALLRERAATPMGASLAVAIRPSFDMETVRIESARTVEAARLLEQRGALPFGSITDPDPILRRLNVAASLPAPLEILEIVALMKAGRVVKAALTAVRSAFPLLYEMARVLPDLGNVVRFLDGRISSSGEFEDRASDDLRSIRREIQRCKERLASLLERVTSRAEVVHALQDDFVSIRSDRQVLPIRLESRSALPGIVHGVSGSGATIFIEPMETVDLNNEIVTLRDSESEEVKRLLRQYGDLLRGRLPELRAMAAGIARLDVLMARAKLGRDMRGRVAEIAETSRLDLAAVRHPLLEASLAATAAPIIPLDLSLPEGTQVMMISGPNTGGKTVSLKTVGLLALMHQAGLMVPAERALLPVFRGIFIDIGDRQSIADHLSTFSARMRTAAAIARNLEAPALVLLDEVGTGTDPEEGVALGIAIIDHYLRAGATIIATTHMEAFKAYAASTGACSNAAMEFDEATLLPTYRLIPGIPGRSGALEVAERIGLPEAILADARARRGGSRQMLADYLARLQQLSTELESRLRSVAQAGERLVSDRAKIEANLLEREKQQRQAIAGEIELALRAIREEGDRFLSGLKDRAAAARVRRQEAKLAAHLRTEARRLIRRVHADSPIAPPDPGQVKTGVEVWIDGLAQKGVVESVRGKRVVARVRGKRITALLEECRPAAPVGRSRRGSSTPPSPPVTLLRRHREETISPAELHLRGLSVDEALSRVDKYLDDAYLESLRAVRLVHGLGSGRLKRAIAEHLTEHPHVATFSSAPAEEGGVGVTLVRLKD
jgi:DNA mismatch repair protein MutS2